MKEYFKTITWLFIVGFTLAIVYVTFVMNGQVYQEIQEMYFDDVSNDKTKRIA